MTQANPYITDIYGNEIIDRYGNWVGAPSWFAQQGKVWHVAPSSGSDSNGNNDGLSFDTAFATLATALDAATANQNDVVLFWPEGNSAALCTDYQSAALNWNKDMVHLIAMNNGITVSPRSRIAWASTMSATVDTVLFTVSGDGCLIKGMQVYCGINDANLSFNTLVTGERNKLVGCHLAGIGHATNDAAGAYSLELSGSENEFRSCTIGLDTIARGTAANSEILLSGGGARNKFVDCDIITMAEAATHQFLIKESAGIDRWVKFINCRFENCIQSTGVQMTEAFDITAGGSPNGLIELFNCSLLGATDWEAATVSGEVYIFAGTSTAATAGLAVAVAAS